MVFKAASNCWKCVTSRVIRKTRVSLTEGSSVNFARILLEAFGGANGELTSAMQYFVQAFSCHNPFPDKYDMLMDIATEELAHLEIVGVNCKSFT